MSVFSAARHVRLVCLFTFFFSLTTSTTGPVLRPRSKRLLLDLKCSSKATDPHSFTPVPGQTKEESNDPWHKYLLFQALIWRNPGVKSSPLCRWGSWKARHREIPGKGRAELGMCCWCGLSHHSGLLLPSSWISRVVDFVLGVRQPGQSWWDKGRVSGK